MRVYNIVTESKFKGLYVPESSCADMITRLMFMLKQNIELDLCIRKTQEILSNVMRVQPNVVCRLNSPIYGNVTLIRLAAFGAILQTLFNIDGELVLNTAHELCTEFLDIEIEEGN